MTQKVLLAGRYEILGLLGEGGMARVYDALDHQAGEQVAIKELVVSSMQASTEALGRFRREAETLRLLNYPYIIKMLDVFSEEGKHYVVMERVMGGDLKHLLEREGCLGIRRTLTIGVHLADALTRAHEMRVIHRDIKPANILMAEDGTPRLGDFGVARLIDSTAITRDDSMVGTLAYVSPEACAGRVVDHRADIWSLGVVFYEMLTGKLPFHLEENTAPAILTAILSQPVIPLETYRADVPPVLAQMIYRMLEKDPLLRLDSARLIGMVLDGLLHDRPAEALLVAGMPPEDTDINGDQTDPFSAVGVALEKYRSATLPKRPEPIQTPSASQRPYLIIGAVALTLMLAVLLTVQVLPSLLSPGVLLVDPIAPGEYMVLVADMELIGTAATNTAIHIVDDLKRKYEVESPFSPVRIRAYPGVITSVEQAAEVAIANRATLILWGSQDGQTTLVNAQLGALADDLPFTRTDVEKLVNAQFNVRNPRQQSLASAVAATMAVVTMANSDAYAGAASGVTRSLMDINAAEVIGSSAAAYVHRANTLFTDSVAFLQELDQAVRLASNTPVLYALRALARARAGMSLESMLDYGTMTRLAPRNWPMLDNYRGFIALFITSNPLEAVPHFSKFIAARPNDWYGYTLRAIAYFLAGDYTNAEADAIRAIELDAKTNWPYTITAPLALRDGRLAEAQAMFIKVQRAFPNPEQSDMFIMNAAGLTREQSPLVAANAAFGQLTLYQWDRVLENARLPGARTPELPLLYLFRGIAECNLGMLSEAEASYGALLALDPDFTTLHLLRADVRRRLGDVAGMQADLAAISASRQAEVLVPLGMAVAAGALTCADLLSFDAETTASQ